LVRSIHLNPVRAGIVPQPRELDAYQGFSMGHVPELTGGGLIRSLGGWSEVVSMRRKGGQVKTDERILGTGYFVNAVVKEAGDGQPLRSGA
jgi:hypothetical protein